MSSRQKKSRESQKWSTRETPSKDLKKEHQRMKIKKIEVKNHESEKKNFIYLLFSLFWESSSCLQSIIIIFALIALWENDM